MKVGIDKITHALACAVIAQNASLVVFKGLEGYGFMEYIGAALFGIITAVSVGYVKEWRDGLQEGNIFDVEDIKADAVGAFAGALLFVLVSLL